MWMMSSASTSARSASAQSSRQKWIKNAKSGRERAFGGDIPVQCLTFIFVIQFLFHVSRFMYKPWSVFPGKWRNGSWQKFNWYLCTKQNVYCTNIAIIELQQIQVSYVWISWWHVIRYWIKLIWIWISEGSSDADIYCILPHNNFLVSVLIHKTTARIMITASNGNIFRVTGLLCGEFTAHRWIPRTKASDPELWCFPLSTLEPTVEQTLGTPVIWDAIAVIVTSW